MNTAPQQISLEQWDARYEVLKAQGLREPAYGGPLGRHVDDGDLRLLRLNYDNSPAALRLWNFLLTEEDRLAEARTQGKVIIGAMKDLGTVPVMAYSLSNVAAFYPDGAWWIPCVMELGEGLLDIADRLGVDESFCPVRAMLGAFLTEAHFPIPDLLLCSAGATCDDLSAIAQRLNGLGYPILWWEIPARRRPDPGERAVTLPGGFAAPASQVQQVQSELGRIRRAIEHAAGTPLNEEALAEGIRAANRFRARLDALRHTAFTAPRSPMPALELLIAEMLAIHFCSDREEALAVVEDLEAEARRRASSGLGYLTEDAVRVFWVNPVADLRAIQLLEECGGRVCGTEYLFSHALDPIPEDLPPLEALAQMALADPMVGPVADRAERICRDIERFGAEAVIISRIPGASHCAYEGAIIREMVQSAFRASGRAVPVAEIEVPPVSDALRPALRTRIQALVESVRMQRKD